MIDEYMVIHEPVDHKHGYGQNLTTKERSLVISNLKPSSGHGFVILSHSVAGWSVQSEKLIHFTLPAAPTAPPAVDLLKVTKNGVLVAWHPPENDNGGLINMYKLEMTDQNMMSDSYSNTTADDESDNMSMGSSMSNYTDMETESYDKFNEANMRLTKGILLSASEDQGDHGVWHRLIKHRDVAVFNKYVMGLETYRNFYFRICCRNEFGWSDWGPWNGPFTPQEGVRVRKFDGDGCITIGWIEPQIADDRHIDKYEVQMCMPSGAMSRKIQVYKDKLEVIKENELGTGKRKSESTATRTVFAFSTIDDNVKTNELVINGLKPGKKYQFRVRPMVCGEWFDWELCVISDVISIPSSAPDVPRFLRIMSHDTEGPPLPKIPQEDDNENSNDGNGGGGDEQGSSSVIVPFAARNNLVVTHDSIALEWVNGVPNGSKIIECEVQCAKVREYSIDDVEKAVIASGCEESYDDYIHKVKAEDSLVWENISSKGEFLGMQSFRAKGLIPGTSYAFRVRQRNEVHWSSFSKASAICTTYLAAPPNPPEIVQISASHAVSQWKMCKTSVFDFSSLDYDLQVARLPSEGIANPTSSNVLSQLHWITSMSRPIKADTALGHIDYYDRVVVDNLIPMTTYLLKVRVKTVAGWTSWSDISEPFRTLGLP